MIRSRLACLCCALVGGAPWWRWTRATGSWDGHRDWLAERGVEVGGGYTLDWSSPWSGGLRHRSSFSWLFDVNAAFDLQTLAGWDRSRAYIDFYSIQGRDPSQDVGDLQGVSNIQADDTAQIAELWVETWFNEQFRLKVGKIDANSEFAFSEEGGEFVNSSGAMTPTLQGFPTYPDPATGINLFYVPDPQWYVGVGMFDGATQNGVRTGSRGPKTFFDSADGNDYFYVAEGGYSWPGGADWGSGRCALGLWHHTADFATWGGGNHNGTRGLYAVLDQRLWREHPEDIEDRQGIGLVAMLGFTDGEVAVVKDHVLVGATWSGPFPDRDYDCCGLLLTRAGTSRATGSPFTADETALELFYKVQLTPAMSVKPDFQYVIGPGGDSNADPVLVAMLRFEVNF